MAVLAFCVGLLCAPAAAAAAESRPPSASGSIAYRDPRLPASLPRRAWNVFYPRGAARPLGPSRDPKFNQEYPHRLYVLGRIDAGDADVTTVPFVVHYLRPTDAPLALRTGGVLARLYCIAKDYLDRGP
ncbi:MAG TPA: hypothetical protein VFU47_01265, partial [Armatimonadota bacterium]|nr:hypothetical protein [Armatimonadota bacterium]